jgi:hypothetical protein
MFANQEDSMKAIFLTLLLISPVAADAQDQTRNLTAPDLHIIKVKVEPVMHTDGSSLANLPGWDRETPKPVGEPSNFEWQAKAELEVQNTGSRAIKSFGWHLSLTVGAAQSEKLRTIA